MGVFRSRSIKFRAIAALSLVTVLVAGILLGVAAATRSNGADAVGTIPVRHIRAVVVQTTVPTGDRSTAEVELWVALDGRRSRAEARLPGGALSSVQIRDGDLFHFVAYFDGKAESVSTCSVARGALAAYGVEAELLGAPQRQAHVHGADVAALELPAGRAGTEIAFTAGAEISRVREEFDPDTGLLLSRVQFVANADGLDEPRTSIEVSYPTDSVELGAADLFALPLAERHYSTVPMSTAEARRFP